LSPSIRFPEFTGEWKNTTLEECVDFLDGQRKPIKSDDRKGEKRLYPYYGASGIIDYIDEYIFDGDYILLSEDGANIIDRNYRVAFINTSVKIYRTKKLNNGSRVTGSAI